MMRSLATRASRALLGLVACALPLLSTHVGTPPAVAAGNSVNLVQPAADGAVPPPVVVYPEDGARYLEPVTAARGTGLPGAVVSVTGSSLQQTPVLEDGTFVVGFLPPLFLGLHGLTMTQSLDGETSEAVVVSFAVAPPPPAIDSPANGATFAAADAPASLSGGGVGGATITATVNGVVQSDEPQANQVWTLTLDQPLPPGDNTITVVQDIGGAVSDPTTITVTVLEPASAPAPAPPAPAPVPAPTSSATPQGVVPSDASAREGDSLAETGGNPLIPLGIGGALLALGAGWLIVMSRRRPGAQP